MANDLSESGARVLARFVWAAACLNCLASPAWAALGQTAESVLEDRQRLGGEIRSVESAGFVVQEIASADGGVVREYLAPGGPVFAVTWQGTTPPDLAQILGAHFEEFRDAVRTAPRGRQPLSVRTPRLVVEMGGHMRAFHGRAYLPDRLPSAVAVDVIR